QTPQQLGIPLPTELSDKWILSRYHQVVQETNSYMDKYGMGEAAKGLYEFIWGDFCDWYIERSSAVTYIKTDNARSRSGKT
ncbi:MAG: class I tRNA ligase family protein, partial [Pseudomonadota bacterium]